jgi:predicted DsbA family dithiol-disulfide isomerase
LRASRAPRSNSWRGAMASKLQVEVWSDVACPWCYVGKRRLESALQAFPRAASVEVTWRSFELDPSAPSEPLPPASHAEMLARKYGRSLAQAQQMLDQMTSLGASEGIAFDYTRIRSGNTFDAHRMLHLARALSLGDALKERLFAAYFCEGRVLSDPATLVELAREVGVDVDRAEALVHTDLYDEEVRAEQHEARQLGITGVPFFLLGRRYGVSGAQPREVLLQALELAANELLGPDHSA